jgi:SAM-dependent methyltransferase
MSLRGRLGRLLHFGNTERRDLMAEIEALGPWFYKFDLGGGVQTPLWEEWLALAHETRFRMVFPELDDRFGGRWPEVTCLDAGCNEGYVGFEIAKRGAKHVVGFDARDFNIRKAEFVNGHLNVPNIEFQLGDVTELSPDSYGMFDLTLCLGLLYHLDGPMDVLRRLRAVTREVCVVDTQVLRPSPPVSAMWGPKLEETGDVIGLLSEEVRCTWNPLASTRSVSFVPNRSALQTMLRHAGFDDVRELAPYEGCFEQYATYDRVIVLAS